MLIDPTTGVYLFAGFPRRDGRRDASAHPARAAPRGPGGLATGLGSATGLPADSPEGAQRQLEESKAPNDGPSPHWNVAAGAARVELAPAAKSPSQRPEKTHRHDGSSTCPSCAATLYEASTAPSPLVPLISVSA